MSVRVSEFSKSVALLALFECALAEPSRGEAAPGGGGCVSRCTTGAGRASAAAAVSEAERDDARDSMLELRALASGGTLSPDGARTVMAMMEGAGGASLALMMLSLEEARARLSTEAARMGAAGGSEGASGGAARDTDVVSSKEGEASGAATDGAGTGAGCGSGSKERIRYNRRPQRASVRCVVIVCRIYSPSRGSAF